MTPPKAQALQRLGSPSLLVSVRSATEALAALVGGCDVLDAKEPTAGALGPVSASVLAEIVAIAGDVPVSAACGELGDAVEAVGVTFAKVGLAGWRGRDWRQRLASVRSPSLVVAAYADAERADSPVVEEVLAVAIELGLVAFLLDTHTKDGRGLLSWVGYDRLASLAAVARDAGMPIALAGSLTSTDLVALRGLSPTWFAVRGAACVGGRAGEVSAERVRGLVRLLR